MLEVVPVEAVGPHNFYIWTAKIREKLPVRHPEVYSDLEPLKNGKLDLPTGGFWVARFNLLFLRRSLHAVFGCAVRHHALAGMS